MSEILLRPVAGQLGDKHLLVVSNGALQYVPFAALPIPNTPASAPYSRAETLIARHEITTIPSASALAALRRQIAGRRSLPGAVAVVADPVFQHHDPRVAARGKPARVPAAEEEAPGHVDLRRFERLVYSRQEADAILGLVPEDRSFRAVSFAANRDTVTGGDLSRYRIVHFATHGDLNAAHPELSRLVFSLVDEHGHPRDGLLHAHEIYDLELPADLVVLSACQTALGKEIRGEGQVNDRATAELMRRFYEHLLVRRLHPAAALREAQLSISQEKTWGAPYYWAGFVLQGER